MALPKVSRDYFQHALPKDKDPQTDGDTTTSRTLQDHPLEPATASDADRQRHRSHSVEGSSSKFFEGVITEEPQEDAGSANGECWKSRNLLTFDGGGVRGYWSLLILARLMEYIGKYEEEGGATTEDHTPAYHSFDPAIWPKHVTHIPMDEEEKKVAEGFSLADEHRALKRAKRFLPCHYFDYIGGSSTGALIAIMLGRLRMTVPDCLMEYRNLGSKVFGKPRIWCTFNTLLISKRSKYDADRLRKVFEDVTKRRREQSKDPESSQKLQQFRSREMLCKTFVTTLAAPGPNHSVSKLRVLRSYDYLHRSLSIQTTVPAPPVRKNTYRSLEQYPETPQKKAKSRDINVGEAETMDISLVARAATAALAYFDPLKVPRTDAEPMWYEDAGFETNNPTRIGIDEIEGLHGSAQVGAVVSIGTARSDLAEDEENNRIKRIRRIFKRAIAIATSPEIVHQNLEKHRMESYFRLNPDSDEYKLSIPLDEWKPKKHTAKKTRYFLSNINAVSAGQETIQTMENAFYKYLAQDDVQGQFKECARELVARRRLRSKDKAKWDRYATGQSFHCSKEDTGHADCRRTFSRDDEFEVHLRDHHKMKGEDRIQEAVVRAMTEFRYQPPR